MYRQFDGYPACAGREIAAFLNGMDVVNGYGSDTPVKAANGMGCLAAQIVSHFKGNSIGNFYLHPASQRSVGEAYTYTITFDKNTGLMIRCRDVCMKKTIFFGCVSQFTEFCSNAS